MHEHEHGSRGREIVGGRSCAGDRGRETGSRGRESGSRELRCAIGHRRTRGPRPRGRPRVGGSPGSARDHEGACLFFSPGGPVGGVEDPARALLRPSNDPARLRLTWSGDRAREIVCREIVHGRSWSRDRPPISPGARGGIEGTLQAGSGNTHELLLEEQNAKVRGRTLLASWARPLFLDHICDQRNEHAGHDARRDVVDGGRRRLLLRGAAEGEEVRQGHGHDGALAVDG